jgi:hypothetical protein
MNRINRPYRLPRALGAALLLLGAALPTSAQDINFHLPVEEIERRMLADSFTIEQWRGSRRPEDRTQRVTLAWPDSIRVNVKWANAPRRGTLFNNEPRYEMAAYVVQKLFLDPAEYVVPPTLLRAFPLELVREHAPAVEPTFEEAPRSVLVALQYWMSGVRPNAIWSSPRFRADTAYARRFANFNILTYLIRHRDTNEGNYLISNDTTNPRVFAVDNGVAFDSRDSNRGDEWRFIRVNSLPRAAIDRLAQVTPEALDSALAVLVEFEIRDSTLIPVEPGPNIDPENGVRISGSRLQLGLTRGEIRNVANRLRSLIREANDGRYRIF